MHLLHILPLISWLAPGTSAAVTIYTDIPGLNAPLTTSTAAFAQTTGNSAYSSLVLTPPGPPGGLSQTVLLQIQQTTPQGISILQKGNFLGLSVELSVASQVLGTNSSFLSPIFLNYLANIRERAGQGPVLRVGGNSQDQSTLYPEAFIDAWGHPQMIQKWRTVNSNPTDTPNINFTPELLYTMAHISSLVNVQWYFGLAFETPYNDSNAMQVAQLSESILGDNLISLQLGNEPDLYANHQRRPSTYGIPDYMAEFGHMVTDLEALNLPREKMLLGPSVCCQWSSQQVFDAGYLTQFGNSLNAVGEMHYPNNNCGISGEINPQDIFANYLTHKAAQIFVGDYIQIAPTVQAAGLSLVMLETNTASCGGFPGLSDSFGAGLWAIDNALALASMNFSTMLLHVGGQHDSYNPFTPPPTNMSKDHLWTTGAVYYSLLAVAETFGQSNKSQIIDLSLESEFRPGYAVYEDGLPTRLALFNFVSDPSGASDYNALYQPQGGSVPDHVNVRYMYAPSVSEKFNITWAGQTMGTMFQSDGRLQGKQETVRYACDAGANTCTIPVKAPSFALVFLTDEALSKSSSPDPSSTLTFATTAYTNHGQHIFMDPSVLATSNGDGGPGPRYIGSTGKGGLMNAKVSQGRTHTAQVSMILSAVALMAGVALVRGKM